MGVTRISTEYPLERFEHDRPEAMIVATLDDKARLKLAPDLEKLTSADGMRILHFSPPLSADPDRQGAPKDTILHDLGRRDKPPPRQRIAVMNLFSDIRALVIDCLNAMVAAGDLPEGLDFKNVTVEPPRDALHGDMATNAAMVLAKPAKLKPRDIAEKLATHLASDARVTVAEVAGPGFLNMRLDTVTWQGVVSTVLANPHIYGRSDMGQGRRVNVE